MRLLVSEIEGKELIFKRFKIIIQYYLNLLNIIFNTYSMNNYILQ